MKEITNPDLFSDHKLEFDTMLKRVITTDQWNDKLQEIREWQEEQERLKGRHIEDDLGGYHEYEQVTEMSPDERKAILENNRKTDYEQKVQEIRKCLGIKDPNSSSSMFSNNMYGSMTGMGMNGYSANRKKKSFLSSIKWYTASKLGRELTTYEIDNNKKLIQDKSNMNNSLALRMNRNKVQITESKADQDFRMKQEDWSGDLYGYRLSGMTTLSSTLMLLLKVPFLGFVPAYFIMIPSLVCTLYFVNKLKEFNDGPINKNYTGSYDNLKKAYKCYQKKKKEEKDKEDTNPRSRRGSRIRPSLHNRPRHPVDLHPEIHSYDEDEDDEEEIEEESIPKSVSNESHLDKSVLNESSSKEVPDKSILEDNQEDSIEGEIIDEEEQVDDDQGIIDTSELLFDKDDPDDEYEIPRSKLDLSQGRDVLYEFEEKYLRWVYQHRAEFSKYVTPKDLLTKVFAPMIVNYNKTYAEETQVSRDSAVFKNLSYILARTFAQIDRTFANADEHDPAFYFCVDQIKETGLFYKIKLRLPQTIQKDKFVREQHILVDTLKKNNKDVVDVNIEMPNDEGFIKIMKLTTNENGDAFLPLISTGDVLRFKGMKADGTNEGIVQKMNDPNDLSLLLGLTNAEYAKVLDIAAHQNTNIMIDGASGSGKSASSGSWFVNLLIMHSPDELGIIILDAKSGSLWANYKYAPHVLGYFGREDIDEYPAIYKILKDVYTFRQNHLNEEVNMKNFYEARKYFKKKGQWEKILSVPRLIIIGDEQAATLTELLNVDGERASLNKTLDRKDKKFAGFWDAYNNNISSLAVVAREGGITITGISQRTDAKSFPRALMAQASIKFVMKTPIQGDVDRMMGDLACPPVGDLPTGSGYIVAEGMKLSQLTTPLFSGDPELLEEFIRIISLAWVIIQSYKEDLSKEPRYYYLTESSKKNISTFKSEGIKAFNLFNRDVQFAKVKQILKTGNGIHFSPDAPQGRLHIDLDAGKPNDVISSQNDSSSQNEEDHSQNVKAVPQVSKINDLEKDNSSEQIPDKTISKENIRRTIPNIPRMIHKDNQEELISKDNSNENNQKKVILEDNLDKDNLKKSIYKDIPKKIIHKNSLDKNNSKKLILENDSNEDSLKKSIPESNLNEDNSKKSILESNLDEDNLKKSIPENDLDKDNLKKSIPESNLNEDNSKKSIPESNFNEDDLKKSVPESNLTKNINHDNQSYVPNESNGLIDKDKAEDILSSMFTTKVSHKKEVNSNIDKIKVNKNQLTANDVKEYFIKNNIHSMKLNELLKKFNGNTINAAINQGMLSIDIMTNIVSLV